MSAFPREPQSFVTGNGQVSHYDVWVTPFLRDLDVYVPGVLFFFAVQHLLRFVAKRAVPRFNNLSEKEQLDWCVRGVAVVNGIICQRSTYLWLSYLWNMPADFEYDMYTPLPGYRVPLAMLNSYFLWDFFVCIYYGWSWTFTIHAVASGVGMYLCSFPCSAMWTPFYSGVYELSNMSFHTAQMTRMVTDQTRPGWHKTLPVLGDAFFVLWFFVIRLAGGLFTSSRWIYYVMGPAIFNGTVHNTFAGCLMTVLFTAVIGVQFFWAGEVLEGLKGAIGTSKASSLPATPTTPISFDAGAEVIVAKAPKRVKKTA